MPEPRAAPLGIGRVIRFFYEEPQREDLDVMVFRGEGADESMAYSVIQSDSV